MKISGKSYTRLQRSLARGSQSCIHSCACLKAEPVDTLHETGTADSIKARANIKGSQIAKFFNSNSIVPQRTHLQDNRVAVHAIEDSISGKEWLVAS